MLLSERAHVNGPLFLLGWVVALTVVFGVVYVLADRGDVSTSSSASDTVSWGNIVFGVLFLLLALRTWRSRPAPGTEPEMPKWIAGIDTFSPAKACLLGGLLAGVNPKNLLLTVSAATGVAQLGLSTSDALVSLVVYVLVGSLAIAGPVLYYLVGGDHAKAKLDVLKRGLIEHNAAVTIAVLLILGVNLIAKGLAPLTT